ncbi:hypothetical protein [Stenotrophomonas pigmentata]|jgi:hypothetical protein|uniref:hypothetical protein n=1 Tax=Stenotrophomonas pigmentata TaxID=3055080 RepID=UPI0026EEC710|nr:hypothetical protein [Stenotrophomonas sp. 610A2]
MGLITGMVVGGLGGLAAINILALIAKNSGTPHDLTTFSSDEDVLAKVDAWANEHGYRLVRDIDGTRVYRKGNNILTSPMYMEVTKDGNKYTVKSYTQINGFILRGDMALTGDTFIAKLPRSMAKKAQNNLFATLNVPGLP